MLQKLRASGWPWQPGHKRTGLLRFQKNSGVTSLSSGTCFLASPAVCCPLAHEMRFLFAQGLAWQGAVWVYPVPSLGLKS